MRSNRFAIGVAVALAIGGCVNDGGADSTQCPAGQDLACVDGNCKCGTSCITPSDCAAGQICACHSLSNDGVCLSQADADAIGAHAAVTCGSGSCSVVAPPTNEHCSDPNQVVCGSPAGCCDEGDYTCNGICYPSEDDAVHACGSGACQACVAGGGTTGSNGSTGTSGGSCNWSEALGCTSVQATRGTRCGTSTSLDVVVTNTCSQAIKLYMCPQRSDGSWNCTADGTFSDGTAGGATADAYDCDSSGQYKIFAMYIDNYNSLQCAWPTP